MNNIISSSLIQFIFKYENTYLYLNMRTLMNKCVSVFKNENTHVRICTGVQF